MIAESTPFGGIHNNSLSDTNNDDWDSWFDPVVDLIGKYDISMWCYINCNWEKQPMWHDVGFGDTRLSSSGLVTQKWSQLILQNDNNAKMDGSSNRVFLTATSLQQNCGTYNDEPSSPIRFIAILSVSCFILLICYGRVFQKIVLRKATRSRRTGIDDEQTSLLTRKSDSN